MIARLIDLCIRNRALVLLLSAALVGFGVWAASRITVDAIPDLSDVQVVIRTEFAGAAPQIVENQVTYPITTAMMAVPRARDVRGFSMFGSSFVYIIFEDGTDLYWARSRVLEQLSVLRGELPEEVSPQLGPDASGVGWVYQYVLTTGRYSAEFPNGFWHDPVEDVWYTSLAEVPGERVVRERLERHRVFGADSGRTVCPVTGKPLVEADVDLHELRSLQDWYLRFELVSVEGVSEVAPAGGAVKQYQVQVDPVALEDFGLSAGEVAEAIRSANFEVGGGAIERGEAEFMVRGLGYLGTLSEEEIAAAGGDSLALSRARTEKVLEDLRAVSLGIGGSAPVRLGDVARVTIGPEARRGIVDWNGLGEAVGGIVVMRHGENARETIARVKERIGELEAGLPAGVAIETGYDRSDLIDRSVATLSETLVKEMLVVALVIVLFLFHARSSLVAAFVLPTAVLVSLGAMYLLGINANIMSLGGIAIAVGVMVDCSIVMVENGHERLAAERLRNGGAAVAGERRVAILSEAAREVGPALFFSLLVITVSFLPVFLLGEQAGKMFRPLAFTKTFAMASASVLAVTLIPVLMVYFLREEMLLGKWSRAARVAVCGGGILAAGLVGWWVPLGGNLEEFRVWVALGAAGLAAVILLPQRMPVEERNPLTRFLEWGYRPLFAAALRFRWALVVGSAVLVVATFAGPFRDLGTEFMPPLEEGDLLYMPTTMEPGLSGTKAAELLQQTNKLIMTAPEVKSAMGKIGAAETATDPAPMNMIETTIVLHRDSKKWRHVPRERFFTDWPGWARWLPAKIWEESRAITLEELVYGFALPDGSMVPGLDAKVQIPGLANSWTMPIRTRIDMLATGIRTPVGIKVLGPDLGVLAEIAGEIERVIKEDPATGPFTRSAISERTLGGKYVNIVPKRGGELERYGLTVADVQETISLAIGGMNVAETVEGLERYPVSLRYPMELRESLAMLGQVRVTARDGTSVPLDLVAELRVESGPAMIKSENARPTEWIFVDTRDIDLGTYVERARELVRREVVLPPGYSVLWSGQFEYIESARERFAVAIPLALVAIAVLLYFATGSWGRVLLIFGTLSFSLMGAIWFLWWLDYNLSVAVVVGIIALLGLDAETSLIMLLYLDNAYDEAKREGKLVDRRGLWEAVYVGAVKRIRPKTMTVLTTIIGLLPLMFATGAGADTMRRLAAPMVGGLTTSFLLELLVYPAVYYGVRVWKAGFGR